MPKPELIPEPTSRSLRIFAFDPSLAGRLDTAGIAEITIDIPWERDLGVGPVGEYIEVVDADPASGAFYKPLNLDEPHVLAQDGLAPSESNPQFHQQMVYAVAMATIVHFEQALGRVALWAARREDGRRDEKFVRRLRIYPHALRDRNAYYSPDKKALLFGYFPVGVRDADNTPGTLVFTCLSHDIIAHETTHALLDGVHPRFNEPVHVDVLAFHEAFADIVALFQHFSYPGVLRDQIARTRGDLATENVLGQLAQQFGRAAGRGRALRDALGRVNSETNRWEPHEPSVRELDGKDLPHERGAILVAAVFGAFLKVYRARTRDLYRIATEGTGKLREGDIHPDLANRLAAEAAGAARQTLQMCIRAIDYCPPVGITFGDYLRAVVTADMDLNPDDAAGYRLAFVESFREWGISPRGARSMSVEGLLWPSAAELMPPDPAAATPAATILADGTPPQRPQQEQRRQERQQPRHRGGMNWYQVAQSQFEEAKQRKAAADPGQPEPPAEPEGPKFVPWNLESDRRETWEGIRANAETFWKFITDPARRDLAKAVGLVLDLDKAPPTVSRRNADQFGPERVAVEVHSVRAAIRRSARGAPTTDLVVEITQRRRGYFDKDKQKEMDAPGNKTLEKGDFTYRAGCTLLVNPTTMEVRRVIRTPGDIADDDQLERVRLFLTEGLAPPNAFDSARGAWRSREPFALLHRD